MDEDNTVSFEPPALDELNRWTLFQPRARAVQRLTPLAEHDRHIRSMDRIGYERVRPDVVQDLFRQGTMLQGS